MRKDSLKNNLFLVSKSPSFTILMLSRRTYNRIRNALAILWEKLILDMKIKSNGKRTTFRALKEEIPTMNTQIFTNLIYLMVKYSKMENKFQPWTQRSRKILISRKYLENKDNFKFIKVINLIFWEQRIMSIANSR